MAKPQISYSTHRISASKGSRKRRCPRQKLGRGSGSARKADSNIRASKEGSEGRRVEGRLIVKPERTLANGNRRGGEGPETARSWAAGVDSALARGSLLDPRKQADQMSVQRKTLALKRKSIVRIKVSTP